MTKINWIRVLLGGLLAGLIINIYEVVWSGVILGNQWKAAMDAIHHPYPASGAWIFFLESFAMGIAAIWLYAAVRTRFGPGPKTAVVAALGFWVVGYMLPAVGLSETALFPVQLLVITTAGRIPEIILATLAGAWLYKE